MLRHCTVLAARLGRAECCDTARLDLRAAPGVLSSENLALYTKWSRLAAEKADAIITVSQASADDVENYWGIDDKPVVATPLASALPFVPDDPEKSRQLVADQLGLDGPYVLSVAAAHRRKNLRGVIEAYARARPDEKLLLVNVDYEGTHAMLAEFGVADRALVTGRLSSDLIPHIYSAASVLVHPSFYEGFGIPVLEAMICGTPVVSSTMPSIPEVAGEAAVLVDPYDKNAVTDALARVLSDDDLREQLIAAGLQRSKEFSWEKTAMATRDVLAAAVASRT